MGLHLMAGWSRLILFGRRPRMFSRRSELGDEGARKRWWLFVVAGRIPAVLKKDCPSITHNCIAQFEFVLAHRIRRAQQMFSLYSRMWGDVQLRQFINRMRRLFMRSGKEFLVGAVSLSVINWDKVRISDDEFEKYKEELEICKKLRVVLKDRKSKSNTKNGKKSADSTSDLDCACPSCGSATRGCCWDTFIDEEDISVWKMEEPNHRGSGLFCYKVFGRYDDVTADDFLSVFLDVKHRKDWDSHVVSLYVVDSEPNTNSDLIYWETKWPVMYSNRDYVFMRRYKIDVNEKQMTVLNQSTEHPNIPMYNNKTRINEYWSHMVIRPLVDFDKPGIEFSLTYFDNPGAALPTAITLWISATGMPEYLRNLRLAALKRAKEREMSGGGASGGGGSPAKGDSSGTAAGDDYSASRSGIIADGGTTAGDDNPAANSGSPPSVPPICSPQPLPSLPPTKERLSPLAAYIHWAKSFL